MPLYRLVYFSTIAPTALDRLEATIADIARASRTNNPDKGLGGCLAVGGNRFLQAVEGRRRFLSDLLARLFADARHCAVNIVEMGPIDAREFPDWALVDTERARGAADLLWKVMPDQRLDPAAVRPDVLRRLLVDLAALPDAEHTRFRPQVQSASMLRTVA